MTKARFLVLLAVGFVLGFLVSRPAAAQDYTYVDAKRTYWMCSTVGSFCNTPRDTVAQACADWATSSGGGWVFDRVEGLLRCYIKDAPTGQFASRDAYYKDTCPAGFTGYQSSYDKLLCRSDVPGTPVPGACDDKNPIIRRYNYGASGPYTAPTNFGSCKVAVQQMLTCGKDDKGTYCFWQVTRTGEPYTGPQDTTTGAGSTDTSTPPTNPTPTPSPPLTPPPPSTPDICKTCVPCPKGTVQAGIGSDGVPMCVGTGTNPPPPPVPPPTTTKPPTTTTGSDGSTVTKQDTVQQNKDGSTTTTTTTTTTAPDGSKSVTVSANTTNAATGSPGSMDRNPQDDKYNLCKQNPTLSICRESSVSGTCGQITCTGDAIQCSTLRAAAAMQCKQQADEDALKASPQTSLGNSILSGADPMKTDIENAIKGTEVDLSKPSLDQAGFLAGGTCIADKTFAVMGRPVVVKFTELCNNIAPLRSVIMACAFIAAYMLVSRSVLSA